MKRILIYTPICCLVIFLSSCQKQLLDIQPYNQISDAGVFSTKQNIEAVINGVYDAAQSGFYAGGVVRGYPFGAASVQQGDMRGEDMANLAGFYQITHQATYDGTTPNNVFMWHTLYSLINKANITIEGIENAVKKGVLTEIEGNTYKGECLFLRALAHHELLINFCRPYADNPATNPGTFYRDFAINTESSIEKANPITRSTVKGCYEKLVVDLDNAENLLPVGKNTNPYRASKAAAVALKMRVKLHMQDWAGVITEGNKIVNTGGVTSNSAIGDYSLPSTLSGLYGSATLGASSESIFYIRNAATDNAGVNGALANMLTSSSRSGRTLVAVSPVIFTNPLWLATDLRKTTLTVNGASNRKFIDKYKDVASHTDAVPIIRFAEVLLTLAEAECRNSKSVSTISLSLLNAIRNRAVNAADQYTISSFTDWQDMVKKILVERRIEFLAEGKRWGDIHRTAMEAGFRSSTGIPSKMTAAAITAASYSASTLTREIAEIPYSDKRFLWPIPLDEVQQNPNKDIQNPDY